MMIVFFLNIRGKQKRKTSHVQLIVELLHDLIISHRDSYRMCGYILQLQRNISYKTYLNF